MHGELAAEHVAPPGDAVTVYPVMLDPPDDDGAVQVTVVFGLDPSAIPATLVAVPIVGAAETVAGVRLDDVPAVPVPLALVAVTEKV